MNKHFLSIIIAASLGLTGCGGDSKTTGAPTIDPDTADSLNAETKINFDIISNPSSPIIVTPTYLAMDQEDGTLSIESTAADPTDISNPVVAMGATDGWSTSQPILVNFKGNPLNPDSAAGSFYLIKSGDPTDTSDSTAPTKLVEGQDYLVQASGDTLTAVLLKPLDPASNYMFAVTNILKDDKNNPVGTSSSYATLKSTATPPSPALLPAQAVTQATETAFTQVGVDKDSIIFSSWFTTASVGDVLFAAKSATALAINSKPSDIWKGTAIDSSIDTTTLDSTLFNIDRPTSKGNTLGGLGEIFTGTIHLPYFLDMQPDKFLNTPWQSGMPSLAKIQYVLANGTDAEKLAVQTKIAELNIDPTDFANVATDPAAQQRVLTALTGAEILLPDGKQLDEARLITRYSPVPKLRSIASIEYTLVLPNNPNCKTPLSNSVTIYQHGVTSSKDTLTTTGLADSLIGDKCRAIFAINLPLHGDRGIGGVTAADNPSIYLNLGALTVARDNLRQSTIDVINLKASITRLFVQIGTLAQTAPDQLANLGVLATLNPQAKVNFTGHSLGAMTGINVANVTNRPTGNDAADQLFAIDQFALANPGAEIPYLLLNSGSFGNLIKGNILASSNADFKNQCGDTSIPLCYQGYEAGLISDGSETSLATLSTIYDSFTQFAYAAQTVLDSVDPINHSLLVPSTTSVYLTQVQNDQTIPNLTPPGTTVTGTEIPVPYSPFTGTTPLLNTMQLVPTTASINGTLVRNAVLFNVGSHSSLLDPSSDAAVTSEMQSEMHSFINGDGKTLTITDTNVLNAAP
ncbi:MULTISPECIES: VolA/Pla-1 family phospholipase [unclassified Photobacterium]|uniref:VolA/Pla-1 family phospholipase n=1 Tax=unclassified Photobacterium TaxID=2628852 RepID=UPI001EDCAE81|nr:MULTISPECIES: VolA/Pla-1 family phospholipase [unclassified Photobacterium]MCG3863009.1 lipase [Photobacterium sp. Ph6]MCG3874539.1 lipase [Photobacterium sp. Ph5]